MATVHEHAPRPVAAWRTVPGMGALVYVGRRILAGIVTLLVISVLIFVGTEILPGDVAQAILGKDASPAAMKDVRHRLGLDRSPVHRYLDWMDGVAHGNLGNSAAGSLAGLQGASVWSLISDRLVNSAVLAIAALFLILPLGLALGVASALAGDRLLDRTITIATVAVIALPEFVIGTILILVFSTWAGLLPPVSILAAGQSPVDHPNILVLPVLTLLLASLASVTRMVRAGMLEALRAPFVETARLSGIGERRVVVRYALRNALAPTVQVMAQTAQWLVGGIIITEAVFGYPGLGQALVQAVAVRDIPFVESVTLLIAAIYIALNIAADLTVVYLVPKLRTSQLDLT